MGASISTLLFQPPTPTYTRYDTRFFKLHTTRGSTISAFFIDYGAPYTIMFSHGNAEDIGLIYPWFNEVGRLLRVNVLAYDYTGYGNNDLPPSEKDCYADCEAAFDFLTLVKGIPARRIFLWGRSLGSGPTCYLARKQSEAGKPVCGVILQSPLMSVYRVAFHFRFSLPGDKFCNIDHIGHINSPIFIMHGTKDEIVPFWHGQELYLATQKKFRFTPFWVLEGGHNNLEVKETKEIFRRLALFINTASAAAF